jgi:hypothetical protein
MAFFERRRHPRHTPSQGDLAAPLVIVTAAECQRSVIDHDLAPLEPVNDPALLKLAQQGIDRLKRDNARHYTGRP